MPPLRSSHDAAAHKRCGTVERLLHLPQLRLRDRYKNGDILKVESVIEVCGEDGFTQIACCGVIATPDEYVVLEGYRP